jgi:hypothetical protein
MFDIHLPHKSIHGIWEFFLHLFTITVGLLIAVQIESCVEWRHHIHVAEEARASLRAEIVQNLKDLKQAQPGLKEWRTVIDTDLVSMQRIQDHPDDPEAQHTSLTVNSGGISLPDTAWKTAQSTGALAYMPYDEAERYAAIYQSQAALLAMEDKPLEDAAAVQGLISKFHWRGPRKITEEQASAVAEKLGQMRMHLLAGDLLMQAAIEKSSAFLENRKARDNFHENLR